jgi:hypothetical protein
MSSARFWTTLFPGSSTSYVSRGRGNLLRPSPSGACSLLRRHRAAYRPMFSKMFCCAASVLHSWRASCRGLNVDVVSQAIYLSTVSREIPKFDNVSPRQYVAEIAKLAKTSNIFGGRVPWADDEGEDGRALSVSFDELARSQRPVCL